MSEPSKYAILLNRLADMQQTPYYALARTDIERAESTIVELEKLADTRGAHCVEMVARISRLETENAQLKHDIERHVAICTEQANELEQHFQEDGTVAKYRFERICTERDQFKAYEAIMRNALIKIASYTQTESLLWWQMDAREALNKCSVTNP